MTGMRSASLGRRLSWWLALQSLAVLTVLCAGVYVASHWYLKSRQQDALAQKQQQVRHLLTETRLDGDVVALRHKLDDFFIGHIKLRLTLTAVDGSIFYRSITAAGGDYGERVQFDSPQPNAAGKKLAATLTLDTRDDQVLLRRLAMTLVSAALAGALMISAGGFALVRLGLRPVHQLVDQTRQLSAERLHHRLDGSAQPEELQPLIAQFNELLARLSMAYDQLEGFNADVAHELCTPMANLVSGTEIALRRARTMEELREVLGSHLDDLHRVSGIVTDMLFLSHADRGATARRQTTPSLAEVVSGVLEFHDAALEEAGLRVEIHGDACGAFDVPLLRRALFNLLDNAKRYGERGSAIQVVIAQPLAREVSVVVADRGVTIAPEQLPRLFDRFYRSEPPRQGAHQHHGLGLSIVSAIARMHGGRPIAESKNGYTAIGFTLATSAPS